MTDDLSELDPCAPYSTNPEKFVDEMSLLQDLGGDMKSMDLESKDSDETDLVEAKFPQRSQEINTKSDHSTFDISAESFEWMGEPLMSPSRGDVSHKMHVDVENIFGVGGGFDAETSVPSEPNSFNVDRSIPDGFEDSSTTTTSTQKNLDSDPKQNSSSSVVAAVDDFSGADIQSNKQELPLSQLGANVDRPDSHGAESEIPSSSMAGQIPEVGDISTNKQMKDYVERQKKVYESSMKNAKKSKSKKSKKSKQEQLNSATSLTSAAVGIDDDDDDKDEDDGGEYLPHGLKEEEREYEIIQGSLNQFSAGSVSSCTVMAFEAILRVLYGDVVRTTLVDDIVEKASKFTLNTHLYPDVVLDKISRYNKSLVNLGFSQTVPGKMKTSLASLKNALVQSSSPVAAVVVKPPEAIAICHRSPYWLLFDSHRRNDHPNAAFVCFWEGDDDALDRYLSKVFPAIHLDPLDVGEYNVEMLNAVEFFFLGKAESMEKMNWPDLSFDPLLVQILQKENDDLLKENRSLSRQLKEVRTNAKVLSGTVQELMQWKERRVEEEEKRRIQKPQSLNSENWKGEGRKKPIQEDEWTFPRLNNYFDGERCAKKKKKKKKKEDIDGDDGVDHAPSSPPPMCPFCRDPKYRTFPGSGRSGGGSWVECMMCATMYCLKCLKKESECKCASS